MFNEYNPKVRMTMNAQITSVTKRLKFMGNWWNKSLLARILVP